jgi:hypothetical protein
MPVPLQKLGRRLPWLAISLAGALWLTWNIIVVAVSDFYGATRPEFALSLDENHPVALRQLSEQKLTDLGDEKPDPEFVDLVQRAMLADTLSSVPLRVLALAVEESDSARARRLMQMAEDRSRRDIPTQIWLADDHLLAGRYPEAMRRIDALLLIWPELGHTLFPVLHELALDTKATEDLIATLMRSPPWRARFFATLPAHSERPSELAGFYAAMKEGLAPLTLDEVRPYLEALLEDGEAESAHGDWLSFMPPDTQLQEVPYNGDFEHEPVNAPFDWSIQTIRGAKAHLTSDSKGGRVLAVHFYNTRVPFRHVSQTVLLEPGHYVFAGEVAARSLENDRGLHWTISCRRGSQQWLGETLRVRGTVAWTGFELEFEVPDHDDCEAQVLRLELPARIGAEQEISGDILFDDLRIAAVTRSARAE